MLQNYSPNVTHLCQCCNVNFNEADNVAWRCEYLNMMDIYLLCHRAMQYHGLIQSDENIIDEDEDDIKEEAC